MTDSLYAILIQLSGQLLLLPNAAVAEVTALDRFEPAEPGAPAWLIGWHATAERRLPVLAFEVLCGGAVPAVPRRGRVVIVHPIGARLGGGGFAVLAQAHPHMVSVHRSALDAVDPPPADDPGVVLTRVRVAGQDALIPDLERVEQQVATLG